MAWQGHRAHTDRTRMPLPASRERGGDWTSALAQPIVASAMPWLVLRWLGGVLILSIRLARRLVADRSLRVSASRRFLTGARHSSPRSRRGMRVARPVAIVCSIRISVPVVLGHLKPVIVLPAAVLSGLSPAQLEAILAHELAHVRRHDYLVNLAQTRDRDAALLPSGRLVGVPAGARGTRALLRRSRGHRLRQPRRLRPRAARARGAQGSTRHARARSHGRFPARARRAACLRRRSIAQRRPRLAASVIALIRRCRRERSRRVVHRRVGRRGVERAAGRQPRPEARGTPRRQASGPATPVTWHRKRPAPLASRWTWAERAARSAGRRAYWIGYTVSPVKTLPPFIYMRSLEPGLQRAA